MNKGELLSVHDITSQRTFLRLLCSGLPLEKITEMYRMNHTTLQEIVVTATVEILS